MAKCLNEPTLLSGSKELVELHRWLTRLVDLLNPKLEDIAPGCWSCIETRSVSSVANVDFLLPTGFDLFRLYFFGVRPAGTDRELQWRLSNDGGLTFLTGTGYRTSPHAADSNGVIVAAGSVQNGDHWTCTLGLSAGKGIESASPAGASGHVEISHALDSASRTRFTGKTVFENAGNGAQLLWNVSSGGVHTTAETHNAIRFYFVTPPSDFAAGDFILTGLTGP